MAKVAIIGGGPSGLAAAKACLEVSCASRQVPGTYFAALMLLYDCSTAAVMLLYDCSTAAVCCMFVVVFLL